MKKLVIIPAYNEEGNIEKTVTDIQNNAPDFDFVIVNDCSTDDTLRICREKGYNVINLPVNLGIGGGVQTGYMYGWRNGYDIAVQFDETAQHSASFLNSCNVGLSCRESTGYGDRFQVHYKRRISVLRFQARGYPVFYMADQAADGTEDYRSYVRDANGEPRYYGTVCEGLSQGLSGTGDSDLYTEEEEKGGGDTGSDECQRVGGIFYFTV